MICAGRASSEEEEKSVTCEGPEIYRGPTVEDAEAEITIIRCEKCGYAHVFPLPQQAEERYSSGKYFSAQRVSGAACYDDEWVKLREYNTLVYDKRLRAIRRFALSSPLRLLDIGTGLVPRWLMHCSDRGETLEGWAGVELDPRARGYGEAAIFHDLDAVQGTFNAITLWYVLEHVADPAGLLRRAWEKLEVGGVLAVEVPNDFSYLQELAFKGRKPAPWVSSSHVNYFNEDALRLLVLEIAPFAAINDAVYTFPVEIAALLSYSLSGNYPHNVNEMRTLGEQLPQLAIRTECGCAPIGRSVCMFFGKE